MSNNKLSIESLHVLFKEISNAPSGDSWLEFDGETYRTDIGYAFDGIRMFLEIVEKRFTETE